MRWFWRLMIGLTSISWLVAITAMVIALRLQTELVSIATLPATQAEPLITLLPTPAPTVNIWLLPTITAIPTNTSLPTPLPTALPAPTETATPLPATPTPYIIAVTATPLPPTLMPDVATATPPFLPTLTPTTIGPILSGADAANCDCSGDLYNCLNFAPQEDAQLCFEHCITLGAGDIHRLDWDNDNDTCEQ